MSTVRRIGSFLLVLSVAMGEVGIHTLRGIEKIKVVIEDLTVDSTMNGVTEDGLRSKAEFALKQIGIVSIDDSDKAADSSVPILYVSLTTDKADGFHTYVIRLELLQAVCLARDLTITASSATTWSTLRFGRVDEHGFGGKIQNVLTIMLQSFQDDFQSANPAVWPPRPRLQGAGRER